MATIEPIPNDNSGYEDAWNEMRQFVLNSFGVPQDVLRGESSYASSSALLKAFEEQEKIRRFGMEFMMNMMLDPLLEEGRRILEEWMAEKAAEQKDPERN